MEATKVKNLMVPVDEYITISEDATLYEAVLALEEACGNYETRSAPFRAVLIRDKSGKVIGKMGFLDVIRCLEPAYTEMGDLRKLSGYGLSAEFLKSMLGKYELWKQPLEDLCRKASERKVGKLVSSPLEGEVVDQDASLNQGIHQLILGHHQSLLVTSKGEVVGILRLADVFTEVARRMRACMV